MQSFGGTPTQVGMCHRRGDRSACFWVVGVSGARGLHIGMRNLGYCGGGDVGVMWVGAAELVGLFKPDSGA